MDKAASSQAKTAQKGVTMSSISFKSAKPAANRGKVAENQVKKALEKMAQQACFDYERNYDSHSAGGVRFQPRTGDFTLFWIGGHAVIEVKEVAHDYRLPKGNFGIPQINRMRKRRIAGAEALVLVRHSTTGYWRRVPFSVFQENDGKGSWDLRDFPQYTSVDLLLEEHFQGKFTEDNK